jgi:hypothetical protein
LPERLRLLRSLIEEDLMTSDVVGYEWTRPIRLLGEGKAAFSFGGSYEVQALARTLGVPVEELSEHACFIPVPAGPNGAPASVAGAMSYAIFKQAAQPELAMRVLERAVAPEALAGSQAYRARQTRPLTPASPPSRDLLSGVQQALGVEDALDLALQLERRCVQLLFQLGRLEDTHPVLAGDRPAEGNRPSR